jgi:hypothetical protein
VWDCDSVNKKTAVMAVNVATIKKIATPLRQSDEPEYDASAGK